MNNDIILAPDERLQTHRRQVQILQNAGLPIPSKWTKLSRQLDDFLGMKSAAVNRLIEAVAHPDPGDDRAILRGLAIAEAAATPQAMAQVTNAVTHALRIRMVEVITTAAADLYQKAGDQFNQTAAAFTACASVIDPETAPRIVVGAEDPQRVAWQAAEQHAARLSLLVPVAATAASFAGLDGIDPDVDNDPVLLPLLCDPTDRDRREVWQAWTITDTNDDGRTSRWGRLLKAGCVLRAANLDEHAPYRECRPEDDAPVPAIDPVKPQRRTVMIQGGL